MPLRIRKLTLLNRSRAFWKNRENRMFYSNRRPYREDRVFSNNSYGGKQLTRAECKAFFNKTKKSKTIN